MSRVTICANCLTTFPSRYASPGLQIGGEYGDQRDPSTHNIDICGDCTVALEAGDFATIHARYRSERHIAVGVKAEIETESDA